MKKNNFITTEVWQKLFPLKVGDRVRVTQLCLLRRRKNDEFYKVEVGMIGVVTRAEISKEWKKTMVFNSKCYPPAILKETLVGVKFPERDNVTTAFRMCELERVEDDEES